MTTHAAITQKRAAQEAGIPATWHLSPDTLSNAPKDALTTIRTCDILTPQELAWTETSSLSELLSHLAQRKVSSVQLTTAFCKRAAVAQQLTRCLTEIFFNRALERARELDEYLEANGKVVGPLHGLPVSIKDRFDIEGVDSTVGTFPMVYTSRQAGILLGYASEMLTGRMGGLNRQTSPTVQLPNPGPGVHGRCSICQDEHPAITDGAQQPLQLEWSPLTADRCPTRTTTSSDSPSTRSTASSSPAAVPAAKAPLSQPGEAW